MGLHRSSYIYTMLASCEASPAGQWVPAAVAARNDTSGRGPPPPCSIAELFAAGLRYPLMCGPRCWFRPPSNCPYVRYDLRTCMRGRWLVFVGDSQVRNLLRFLARALGVSNRLPDSMRPPPTEHANESSKPANFYDDWDMDSTDDDTTGVRLSFRFSGPDYGKYERVAANPHQLEVFDMNLLRHRPSAPSLSSGGGVRRPDLLLFSSSFWTPTCDRHRRLGHTFVEASKEGVAAKMIWTLLGSYSGPLDKYDWPELTWGCERSEALRVEQALTRGKRTHMGRILDMKPLMATETRPDLVAQCPMIRRELYGLSGGGGIHYGPAVLDAWTQIIAGHLGCAGKPDERFT